MTPVCKAGQVSQQQEPRYLVSYTQRICLMLVDRPTCAYFGLLFFNQIVLAVPPVPRAVVFALQYAGF